MALSLIEISKLPNAKVFSDYQMYLIIRKLSQGYTVKSACYHISKASCDGYAYYMPLYTLKKLHIFHRKIIVPFMILEQTEEEAADVVDFILSKADYSLTIHFSKYVSMWLNGAHNVKPDVITKLLNYVNRRYIIVNLLCRRAKVAKWDIEATDVNKGTGYRQRRRRLIASEMVKIAYLVELLGSYSSKVVG